MAELKTQKNKASVKTFLKTIKDEKTRGDCETLVGLMQTITKDEPVMWGTSIVGFGTYHYLGKSGREGDWFICGFSPRKQNLTLYLMGGLEMQQDLLAQLGKHKAGKGCLYVKNLDGIDLKILKSLVKNSVKTLSAKK